MDKKYIVGIILLIIIIGAILVIAGMNINGSNNNVNNTTNITTNNTTNTSQANVTINATHIDNNTDESSNGQSSGDSGRFREIRDSEYLGDNVVYQDTYTGRYYYQGQEMDYASLADEYNREHGVGPYAQ